MPNKSRSSVIMGGELGPEISRIYTDRDSDITGRHRNALLPDEGGNKFYKLDIDTSSKINIDITHCSKYLFNDPLNQNLSTPSSNFAFKDYGTPTTLPKDRK